MRIPPGLQIDRLEMSPVYDLSGQLTGYEANCFLPDRSAPIGGGFGSTELHAKTIAVAEAIERFLIFKISEDSELSKRFETNEDPTSSGFAFHPDAGISARNALCEAFEHSIRYHLIRKSRLTVEDTSIRKKLASDPLSLMILSEFTDVSWHKCEQSIDLELGSIKLKTIFCIAATGLGFCWGAGAGLASEDEVQIAQHCLIEAWRNKRIALLEPLAEDSLQRRRVRKARSVERPLFTSIHEDGVERVSLRLFESSYFPEAGGYLTRARMNTPSWADSRIKGAI